MFYCKCSKTFFFVPLLEIEDSGNVDVLRKQIFFEILHFDATESLVETQ